MASIRFMATPAALPDWKHRPLFGTVSTRGGDYTGFIQWNMDEDLTSDRLDGKTEQK